ncbi:MAG TPA: DUF1109 domain-containing protein [Caulobacteraceae bacterium]|jgi:hypothetical protein|nr:DUF1109 domain-containing protein [Caulobacteraceae bacterium]
MRTADLVSLLAKDASPVRAPPPGLRLAGAALAGAAISAALLLALLGLRPMHEAMHSPSFWMKAAYTLILAAAGWLTAASLARPGGRAGIGVWLAVAGVAWLASLAMMETMRTPASGMTRLWLGWTWNLCPWRILALAAPVFVAALRTMQHMAPTRPALAGAAAGLFAGGVGASVYGLYCEETAAAFVVLWYTLGVAACAALGAAIGSRWLRW